MQSENSILKKLFEQSVTKWVIVASLILALLLSTFLLIGLKSQYVTLDFCVATINCSQTPEQIADDAQIVHFYDESIEDSPTSAKSLKVAVNPLGAAIVAGVTSSAVVTGLVGLGLISLPIELVLALGALISSGTYLALKTLY